MNKVILASGIKRYETRGEQGTLTPGVITQDLYGNILIQSDLKFTPHFVLQNPSRPDTLILLDKGGPLGAIGTIREQKLSVKYFKSSSGEFTIYGHGQFFDQGRKYIGTERETNSGGRLVIRNGITFEVEKTISLPGFGPHDCIFVDQGKTLAVAMDGSRFEDEKYIRDHRGCILLYDLPTESVIGKIECERETGFGHLAFHDGILIALETGRWSQGSEGMISVGKVSEGLSSLKGVPEINKWGSRETLSVTVDTKRSRAIVTNPMGNIVTVWDLRSKAFVGYVEVPTPAGVLFCDELDSYIVTSPSGFIYHIDPDKLEVKSMRASRMPGNYSSHLSRIYL